MKTVTSEEYQQKLKAGIWTTKDGRCLLIKEMTTPHLQQTIGYLRRNNWWLAEEWIDQMRVELESRKKVYQYKITYIYDGKERTYLSKAADAIDAESGFYHWANFLDDSVTVTKCEEITV